MQSDERALLQQIASHLPVQQLSRGGGVRYCAICELIKPDRCHHCSVCNRFVYILIVVCDRCVYILTLLSVTGVCASSLLSVTGVCASSLCCL